jgi:hypothetical protein
MVAERNQTMNRKTPLILAAFLVTGMGAASTASAIPDSDGPKQEAPRAASAQEAPRTPSIQEAPRAESVDAALGLSDSQRGAIEVPGATADGLLLAWGQTEGEKNETEAP